MTYINIVYASTTFVCIGIHFWIYACTDVYILLETIAKYKTQWFRKPLECSLQNVEMKTTG